MKNTPLLLITVISLITLIGIGWLVFQDRYSPPHEARYSPPPEDKYVPPDKDKYSLPDKDKYLPPDEDLFSLPDEDRYIPSQALTRLAGKRSIKDVVRIIGETTRKRLKPYFDKANIPYPPKKITLLALKDRAQLELWAETENRPVFVRTYPIKALSGDSGPKLREGDGQVPEGIYNVLWLNPNSSFHLSMKLNYPNSFDLRHARAEGRNQPGTNIFIHGRAVSIGCLAMGDRTIEELFILATDVGRANIKVVIAPTDPRIAELDPDSEIPWTAELYKRISNAFKPYKRL